MGTKWRGDAANRPAGRKPGWKPKRTVPLRIQVQRKKKGLSLGAVRHDKQQARQWATRHVLRSTKGTRTREITLKITVRRGERKGEAAYESDACVVPARYKGSGYPGAKRCHYGHGSSPTSAMKNALTGLTKMMR